MEDQQNKKCIGFEEWWEKRSIVEKIAVGIGFGILGVAVLAFFGWVTMSLWNWLMPDLFGLKRIGYWQAWGLLILSSILFKGHGSGDRGNRHDRKRRRELRRYMEESKEAETPAAPEA